MIDEAMKEFLSYGIVGAVAVLALLFCFVLLRRIDTLNERMLQTAEKERDARADDRVELVKLVMETNATLTRVVNERNKQ